MKILRFLSLFVFVGNLLLIQVCQATALDSDRSFLNLQNEQDKTFGSGFNELLRDRNRQRLEKNTEYDASGSDKPQISLIATPFYSRTFSSGKIGQYFGVAASNAVATKNTPTAGASEVDIKLMLRDKATAAPLVIVAANEGVITLEPRQISFGGHLAATVKMCQGLEGFSLAVNTAVVRNKTVLEKSVTGDVLNTNASSSVSDYLAGIGSSPFQVALAKAKIDGNARSATRLSDVNVQLRYAINEEETQALSVFADFLIPTGTEPTGEFLFEPVVGGRSWFGGAGVCGRAQLYEGDAQTPRMWLVADALWRYGLKSNQIRVPDIKGTTWGKYQLTVQAGQLAIAANTSQFIPAANIVTQEIEVRPRGTFKFNSKVCMAYEWANAEIGYQFCYKQEEANTLKTDWADNAVYRILDAYVQTSTVTTNIATGQVVAINKDNFELNHPSQSFHSLFATFGMTDDKESKSWALAAGFAVNLSSQARVAPRSWDGFVKLGITF